MSDPKPLRMQIETLVYQRIAEGKPINSSAAATIHTPDYNCILLANGNEAKPCAWKAAETAVRVFKERFEQADAENFEKALKVAWKQANVAVRDLYGICSGAATSFAVVVADKNGHCWVLQAGDTGVFQYCNGMLQPVSIRQKSPQLGTEKVVFDLQPIQLQAGEGLFLTKVDGVTGQQQYKDSDIAAVFKARNLEDSLYVLMQEVYLPRQTNEDIGVAMIRCLE